MAKADRRMKRWQEQRWILDAVIRTVGVEWDQSRLRYSSAPVVADATSASLGESRHTLMADWLLDRLNGRPMTSERVFVDSAGNAHVTAVA